MEKRYNFRIYPTAVQEEQIRKNFGCVRFIYNYYLVKRKEAYENGQGIIGYNEMCRDMTRLKRTPGYEWLREADHNSLQRAIKQLDLAYKAFFRNVKKKDVSSGYPCFKSKKDTRQSYVSPASQTKMYVSKKTGKAYAPESSVALHENQIKLPKLGLVKCRVSKQVEGRILSATVIKLSSGKYYVSVLFTECASRPLPKTGAVAGLHMGLRCLVTTSNGVELSNPKYFKQSRKKIARFQRELSRKTSGGKNYEKVRIKLTREYEHIKNQKMDAIHKLTTQLVRDYDQIYARDEPLTKIMRDRRYAAQLMDAGWGEMLTQLSYKCGWYGKQFVKINHLYPSTRTCSCCGYEHMDLSKKKNLREWDCPNCHTHHNRGVNAAINILQEGLRQMAAV